ncbi:hypothetical protein Rxycam_01024 [Rubrobacter xylanophilus DSM 9941]|uniref:hypothetical protein n=1 Tax=Rubrobacter xylanophilus TaxID=49319 RepID=UPI001C63E4FE|nr:hypothetical protein [Rubrobacter xylanophilus]QYJ15209.1 hypothetical protein Rxycam_01024 [Rubrobacter xylanophilus DSM 9941]
MDLLGWIGIGLLAAAAGELVLPGRSPGGIGTVLLIGAAGALLARLAAGILAGEEAARFGVTSILWATLGSLTLIVILRLGASVRGM